MNDTKQNSTELAAYRTQLAAERTLMAWIRTSLFMISFGFTIYKFMQVFQEQKSLKTLLSNGPRNVGLTLIGIGTFALIIAAVQHYKYIKNLKGSKPYKFWIDLSFMIACLLLLLGLLMFISIFTGSGLFN